MGVTEIYFLATMSCWTFAFVRNIRAYKLIRDYPALVKRMLAMVPIGFYLCLGGFIAERVWGFDPNLRDRLLLVSILIPAALAWMIPVSVGPGRPAIQRAQTLWQASLPELNYHDGEVDTDASAYADHPSIVKAKELIRSAIEFAPRSHIDPFRQGANSGTAWQELGLLYRVTNQLGKARECFEKSRRILEFYHGQDSASREILDAYRETCFRMGELNHAEGKTDSAREWYARTLQLDEKLEHDEPLAETKTRALLKKLNEESG